MKLLKLALQGAWLLAFSHAVTAIAADAASTETSTYQSAFDDYKPLANDRVADWKAINAQSSGGGHAGHSMHGMQGMQHSMSPEQMANMSKEEAADKEMPGMEGMSHSDMKGMDHGQMQHDPAMAPMQGMNHDEMQVMPSDKPHATQQMDHGKMSGHDHEMPAAMDRGHANMADMQHSHEAHDEALPEKAAHQDYEQDQGHDHAKMPMAAAESIPPSQHMQIIPNFHPVAVHFPIALTPIAFLLSLLAYARRHHAIAAQLAAAGHLTLWLAALGAAIATLFGWLAYNSVNHDDAGHAAMLLHRAWAIPTATGLVLLATWDVWKHRINQLMSLPALLILLALSGTVLVTAWLGGEVVYRHGIGVLSLPASEGMGHSHHHAHASKTNDAVNEMEPDDHTEHHHDDEKGESHEH